MICARLRRGRRITVWNMMRTSWTLDFPGEILSAASKPMLIFQTTSRLGPITSCFWNHLKLLLLHWFFLNASPFLSRNWMDSLAFQDQIWLRNNALFRWDGYWMHLGDFFLLNVTATAVEVLFIIQFLGVSLSLTFKLPFFYNFHLGNGKDVGKSLATHGKHSKLG